MEEECKHGQKKQPRRNKSQQTRKLLFRSGATLAVTVVTAACSRRPGIAKAELQWCHMFGDHSGEVRTGGSFFHRRLLNLSGQMAATRGCPEERLIRSKLLI